MNIHKCILTLQSPLTIGGGLMQVSMGTGGGGDGAAKGCSVAVPPVGTDFCDVMLLVIERGDTLLGSGGRGASGTASICSSSFIGNLEQVSKVLLSTWKRKKVEYASKCSKQLKLRKLFTYSKFVSYCPGAQNFDESQWIFKLFRKFLKSYENIHIYIQNLLLI